MVLWVRSGLQKVSCFIPILYPYEIRWLDVVVLKAAGLISPHVSKGRRRHLTERPWRSSQPAWTSPWRASFSSHCRHYWSMSQRMTSQLSRRCSRRCTVLWRTNAGNENQFSKLDKVVTSHKLFLKLPQLTTFVFAMTNLSIYISGIQPYSLCQHICGDKGFWCNHFCQKVDKYSVFINRNQFPNKLSVATFKSPVVTCGE